MLAWIIGIALMTDPITETAPDAVPLPPAAVGHQKDVQAVTQVLNDQYAAWNRHDIDAYMTAFWQSPNLIFVTEGQVCLGWQDTNAMFQRNYSNRELMGIAIPERIQVNVISDDSAITLEWWTVRFKKTNVHGLSTASWRKFSEGWRIVENHTSTAESPN
jgi:ketosteroid isomerase-like protein